MNRTAAHVCGHIENICRDRPLHCSEHRVAHLAAGAVNAMDAAAPLAIEAAHVLRIPPVSIYALYVTHMLKCVGVCGEKA